MAKAVWKPGNFIYPVPAVLVSCQDGEGRRNLFTAAWTGTVCTNPPMAYVSVRPERYSYHMLRETGAFVINLTTEPMARAVDYCGVKSGRDVDKWKETGLTPAAASVVKAPLVLECPVNVECRVTEVKELGSHHMFLAEVKAIQVDEGYLDEKGKFWLRKAKPLAYSHGTYYGLSEALGTFGYSIRKNTTRPAENKKKFKGKTV
ncbi:flavin reductase family protein [Qiania dongpingensis]|uniref:Flavin reductase family protein n=1 Tax=Qiania dongpingensis TaxID=2763669 RepID=A0A7G9G1G9_9FIRM|nr:flavin reductase family protein [Qiania dongpingensis]QNM04651.1 flavin reductase family protein [Qiania dongpingensis]